MASTVSFNPVITTGVSGAFLVSTGGYVQGAFLDDPANQYNLQNGFVGSSQSTPLWGGLPVTLAVGSVNAPEVGLGLVSATSLSSINGWTCYNMSAAGIITSSSNAPQYSAGMSLNYVLPGSNIRLPIPVNPSVLNSLVGDATNVSLYWDPTNLRLDTSSSGNYGPLPIKLLYLSNTSKTVSYSSGTGATTWVNTGSVAVCVI
jgi:hypothetical protein